MSQITTESSETFGRGKDFFLLFSYSAHKITFFWLVGI